MKRRWLAGVVGLSLLCSLAPLSPTGARAESPAGDYIVKLRSDAAVPLALDEDVRPLGLGMYRVDSMDDALSLAGAGAVEFIEPNYTRYLFSAGLVDDPYYAQDYQWNIDFMGMGPLWQEMGLTGAGITVAVIDTGLSPHEDLDPERMLPGYNIVNNTDDATAVNHHGSFVAGVLAAQADNALGVAGVAHRANILPYQVFQNMTLPNGKVGLGAKASDIVTAILQATDHGAQVINLSLGSPDPDRATQEAVDYALSKGVIVVAAAGNEGGTSIQYPAGCDGVIGVGALGAVENGKDTLSNADGAKGQWAQYSNYNTSVFVSAPGTSACGPLVTDLYGRPTTTAYLVDNGTSYAAPCVSALAALAKEYDRSIDAHGFQNLLRLTAQDRGEPGWDPKYGYGSADAASLAAALPPRSITYVLNDGAFPQGTEPPASFRTYQDEDVALPVPVREGYAFMGWYQTPEFSDIPQASISLPALEESRTYYAKWLDNSTALSDVTYSLGGQSYPLAPGQGDSYRLYLPHGTDLAGGALTVRAAAPTTDVYLIHSDADPGLWTVRATAQSGDQKEYPVVIDLSRYAPALAPGQSGTVAGTARPGSLDAATPTAPYTADLSAWFADPDTLSLTYTLDELTVNGVPTRPGDVPYLRLEGAALSYAPTVLDAGKVLSFVLRASDGQFTSPKLTVTITVGDVPADQPVPSPTPSAAPEPTPTVPPSQGPTQEPSPSVTPAPSEAPSISPTQGPTPTLPPSAAPPPSADVTPAPTASQTPDATPTPSSSARPSQAPSQAPPPTPTPNGTPEPSAEPSQAPSQTPPSTPAPDETPSPSPGATPEPSVKPSQAPSQTPPSTPTPGGTPTPSPNVTPKPTAVPVHRPSGSSSTRQPPAAPSASPPAELTGRPAEEHDRFSPAQGAVSFADIDRHWARDAIVFTTRRELTRGMTQTEFMPERPASRAMIFTLLARMTGERLSEGQGNWYDSAVNWAVTQGLSDGTRPQAPVERQELVTLLWRWAGRPEAQSALEGFTDLREVSAYAREPLAWAVENGILTGRTDATIDPHTGATRAETAVILQRFILYRGNGSTR